jgi:alpha-L-fucosidase
MGAMLTRRSFLAAAPLAAFAAPAAPAPYGALPSPRHMKWHDLETYAFLHFTVNTFTDREWGYGDEDPRIFNPAQFDANQMIEALQAGGMKAVILTCKHHDGFCLWPTRTTEHSIKKSPWKDGKGDVVREIAEAARRKGMKFGVYLSPWDRNHPQYGRPAYVQVYREQLKELLTGYGPIYEVWHDGANGGDGFYGGAREKRTIDKKSYYDWPATWEMVRKLQPDAVIFSDVGPDIRWVGNEKGFANETCWSTYDPVGADGGPPSPGDTRSKEGTTGHRKGTRWLPAECDVSIRPGWFWHEKENARVKSPRDLLDLYYRSVGRNASFLLNVPPDRRGLLHENDVASLKGYGDLVRRTFATNLAAGSKLTASNVRGKAKQFSPANVFDGSRSSYWATDDGVTTADILLEAKRPVRFNVVRLREPIALGQRVEKFSVEAEQDGAWKKIGEGTSIGACRILRLSSEVTAAKVRVRVEQSPAAVALAEVGLFLEAS